MGIAIGSAVVVEYGLVDVSVALRRDAVRRSLSPELRIPVVADQTLLVDHGDLGPPVERRARV